MYVYIYIHIYHVPPTCFSVESCIRVFILKPRSIIYIICMCIYIYIYACIYIYMY